MDMTSILFAILFYFATLLFVVGLLYRINTYARTPAPVWGWVAFIQPFGVYAGLTMLLGLGGLWARRLFVERIRYISTPSDHLMLVLLIGIAASGLSMKFVAHTDVIAVKK